MSQRTSPTIKSLPTKLVGRILYLLTVFILCFLGAGQEVNRRRNPVPLGPLACEHEFWQLPNGRLGEIPHVPQLPTTASIEFVMVAARGRANTKTPRGKQSHLALSGAWVARGEPDHLALLRPTPNPVATQTQHLPWQVSGSAKLPRGGCDDIAQVCSSEHGLGVPCVPIALERNEKIK